MRRNVPVHQGAYNVGGVLAMPLCCGAGTGVLLSIMRKISRAFILFLTHSCIAAHPKTAACRRGRVRVTRTTKHTCGSDDSVTGTQSLDRRWDASMSSIHLSVCLHACPAVMCHPSRKKLSGKQLVVWPTRNISIGPDTAPSRQKTRYCV